MSAAGYVPSAETVFLSASLAGDDRDFLALLGLVALAAIVFLSASLAGDDRDELYGKETKKSKFLSASLAGDDRDLDGTAKISPMKVSIGFVSR